MNKFNIKLKELRQKNGLTQKKLADMLNISQSAFLKYEKGQAEPSLDTLCKLAKMFNVSVDELIGFVETEDNSNIINLEYLDDIRKNLIINILKSNDVIVGRMDAFYQGVKLAEEERIQIMNKIKGQK